MTKNLKKQLEKIGIRIYSTGKISAYEIPWDKFVNNKDTYLFGIYFNTSYSFREIIDWLKYRKNVRSKEE